MPLSVQGLFICCLILGSWVSAPIQAVCLAFLVSLDGKISEALLETRTHLPLLSAFPCCAKTADRCENRTCGPDSGLLSVSAVKTIVT